MTGLTEHRPTQQEVTTASGCEFDYDDLVVGTGVRTDPAQIPGLTEINAQFGDYHSTLDQARKLWANLEHFQGGTIVAGPSLADLQMPALAGRGNPVDR